MNDLWVIRHEHEYGVTLGFIESDHEPSEEECVKALGLDFEPDKGEFIEILYLDRTEIVTLPPTLAK